MVWLRASSGPIQAGYKPFAQGRRQPRRHDEFGEGSSPTALVRGSDDNFYGTTASGGANNDGTAFEITPARHSFYYPSLSLTILRTWPTPRRSKEKVTM